MTTQPDKPKRWRFGLRSFLLCMFIIGFFVGLIVIATRPPGPNVRYEPELRRPLTDDELESLPPVVQSMWRDIESDEILGAKTDEYSTALSKADAKMRGRNEDVVDSGRPRPEPIYRICLTGAFQRVSRLKVSSNNDVLSGARTPFSCAESSMLPSRT